MDQWVYDAAWPAEAASVRAARDFVTAHLEKHRLPGSVPQAVLVVSELATNAVRHARTPFAVTLEQEDGTVTVSVRDAALPLPRLQTLDPLAAEGRGLVMVAALSDTWGVTCFPGGGKAVWATFAATPA